MRNSRLLPYETIRECRIGTAKFFTLLLLLYRTSVNGSGMKIDMTVSMRPIPAHRIADAVRITAHYPRMHGAPIHIGYPEGIGIKDIMQPDFGDAIAIGPGELPVFWPCGGTVFTYAQQLACPICITHTPSHMFVLDVKDEDYFEF